MTLGMTVKSQLTVSKMLAIGGAFLCAAMSPAIANSAANASDSFRVSGADMEAATALGQADIEFRSIHDAWGQAAGMPTKVDVFVPSYNPVELMKLSSGYGPRRAPRRGASRVHKGIDVPGPVGTPIYATADGMVGRAQWVGGYGKFIELEHGNQIQTRYGHLSALNVRYGQRVKKGQVIGYMGNTGRSTGSHLHYEVRVGGTAVNPMSFLAPPTRTENATNALLAAKGVDTNAKGGPED